MVQVAGVCVVFLEVDLETKTVTRRIVGVIPNATYSGKLYRFEEVEEILKE